MRRLGTVFLVLLVMAALQPCYAASVSLCHEFRWASPSVGGEDITIFDFTVGADIAFTNWISVRPQVLLPAQPEFETSGEIAVVFSGGANLDLTAAVGSQRYDGGESDMRYRVGLSWRAYNSKDSALFIGIGLLVLDTDVESDDSLMLSAGWRGR